MVGMGRPLLFLGLTTLAIPAQAQAPSTHDLVELVAQDASVWMKGGKHLLPWDAVLAPVAYASAPSLWRARDENEVAFQEQFFGKTLLVDARVISVKMSGRNAYIDAASSPYGFDDVLLVLTPRQTMEADSIRRGQDIVLACEGILAAPGEQIILTDCAWPPLLAAQKGIEARADLIAWRQTHEPQGLFKNIIFRRLLLKMSGALGAE